MILDKLLGYKTYIFIGLAVIVGGYVALLHITLANRNARIATLDAQVTTLTNTAAQERENVRKIAADNEATLAAFNAAGADAEKRLQAAVMDRDRLIRELRSANTARSEINEAAALCVGNPPAYGAVDDWLRANPDRPSPRGFDRRGARGEAGAGREPYVRRGTGAARRQRRRSGRRSTQVGTGACRA